jgi:hypothetical protein
LQMLELTGTKITDAGMVHLAKLARLQDKGKDKTKPIVEGAIPPKGLPPLPGFSLASTKIGDAGLAHLKSMRGMQRLDLSNTQVTDVGLKSLHGVTSLQAIDVRGTKATSEGIAALRKALPRVRVIEK